MPSMLATAQVHGMSTESVTVLLAWIVVVLAMIGLCVAALVVAVGRWCAGSTEIATGLAAVAIVSIVLAWTDPLDLGFLMGWRFLFFAVTLGVAWLAMRAAIGYRRRRNATPHPIAEIVWGAGAFTGTVVILVLMVIAVLTLA